MINPRGQPGRFARGKANQSTGVGQNWRRAGLTTKGFEIVNLGSDQPVELMTAIRLIERLVGKPAKLNFEPAHRADVTATWANIQKARDTLHWSPRTCFSEGVESLVSWYRDNAAWARLIETRA